MRKLHFIFLLFTFFGFAQLPVTSTTSLSNPDNDVNFLSKGNYAQDTANERQQYVGTWEYNQNGVLFQVKIIKVNQYLTTWNNSDFYNYSDVVLFRYKLVINGSVLYDDLNQNYNVGTTNPTAIKKGTDNYLSGIFIDKTKNVLSHVTIKRLNTSPLKIIFNLSDSSYSLLNSPSSYNPNEQLFYVPTGEIEMVKIN